MGLGSPTEAIEPFLPGATIGVLGGGQLGRMLGYAARRLGYRFCVYDPKPDCPASAIADEHIVAAYDDQEALQRFGQSVDVVTFEFESIPAHHLIGLSHWTEIQPSPQVLATCRNRQVEKTFLDEIGVPIAPWQPCDTADQAAAAAETIQGKGVLKTTQLGYDGKGQRTFTDATSAMQAFTDLGGVACVAEAWVPFDRELSTLVARSASGETAVYPIVENRHVNHILDVTLAPAPSLSPDLKAEANRIAQTIATRSDLIGLLAVEMFVLDEDTISPILVVNELAPRPHNSGHYTIEACVTDQFEQQLRAITNLPLGDPSMRVPAAAMANLLGDIYRPDLPAMIEPQWARCLADQHVKLHLYGKDEPRIGRKMGHLTATAEDMTAAHRSVIQARESLQASST